LLKIFFVIRFISYELHLKKVEKNSMSFRTFNHSSL
jgi:hypothetical protein